MRSILFASLILSLHVSRAQAPCDCLTAFDSVRTYFETNHPGLNTWRGTAGWAPYQRATEDLRAEVAQLRSDAMCPLFIQRYVRSLKDHHSWAGTVVPTQPQVDEVDSASVQAFLSSEAYRNTPVMRWDTAVVLPRLRALPRAAAEGIYSDGANYRIALVPSTDPAYDLAGVVLWSASRFWTPGMVKLQLKHVDGDVYTCALSMRYHVPVYTLVQVRDGTISEIGFRKEGASLSDVATFHAIDSATNYLRIPSFDGGLYARLDSFYAAHEAEASAKRNLIIDLRGNGGGSEGCWEQVIPYIYVDSLRLVGSDLFASPGNIARFAESLAQARADSTSGNTRWTAILEQQLARMRQAASGTFLPWDEGPANYVRMAKDQVPRLPSRVLILQDEGCASATESFIYYATRHAGRVTTIGTHTGGYMAYGNVMGTTICGYPIGCTTTRYEAFRPYEFVGIPPQVPTGPGEDALDVALRILREQR